MILQDIGLLILKSLVEDRGDGVEDGARFAIAKDVVLMFLRCLEVTPFIGSIYFEPELGAICLATDFSPILCLT